MPVVSTSTRTVQDEHAPDNLYSRVRSKAAHTPRVDGQGREVAPVPKVAVSALPVPVEVPGGTLAKLAAMSERSGVNLPALLDKASFVQRVSEIDPDDNDALASVFAETVVADPALVTTAPPLMKPNRAQGGSSRAAHVYGPRESTPRARIAKELSRLPEVDGQGRVLGNVI